MYVLVSVCGYVHMGAVAVGGKRASDATVEIIGICEPPSVGAENQVCVFCGKSRKCLS